MSDISNNTPNPGLTKGANSTLRTKLTELLSHEDPNGSFTHNIKSSVEVAKSTVCIARTKYTPGMRLRMAVDENDATLLRVWKRL